MWPFRRSQPKFPSRVTFLRQFQENRWPAIAEIASWFENYRHEDWSGAGTGFLRLYGAEGTEGREFYKERIDVGLDIFHDAVLGFAIRWTKTGGGHSEAWVSKGNDELLGQWVEYGCDCTMSKALYVEPSRAWLALREFLETNGGRPSAILGYDQDHLPRELLSDDDPHET